MSNEMHMFKDFQTRKNRLAKQALRKSRLFNYLRAPSSFKLTMF
jgi:hypothetical protein